MNRWRCALALAAAVWTAGCQQQMTAEHVLADPDAAAELGYRIQWVQKLPLTGGARITHAEVLGDRVVILDDRNMITVFSGADGRLLWSTAVGRTVEKFTKPVRMENRILVTSETRIYHWNIDTGEHFRVHTTTYATNSSSIITGPNRVVNGSPTGLVYSQNLDEGLMLWNYKMDSGISTNPMLIGPSLIVTTVGGQIASINPANGALLWRLPTWGRISAQPAATEQLLFVASEDQSLYCVEKAIGRINWRYYSDESLRRSPFPVPEKNIVLQPAQAHMLGIHMETGKLVWKSDFHEGEPFALRNGLVYHHVPGKGLVLMDPTNGRIAKEVPFPAVRRVRTDTGKGASIYLFQDDGQMLKLSPR
jgi:outer membrane protein assembly factor BamB